MNIFYCQCYNRYKNGIFLSYNSDICRDSSDLSNVNSIPIIVLRISVNLPSVD